MNAMIDGEYPENITKLTEKQKQCLRLVGLTYTSKQIAVHLGISSHTVDNRLKLAVRKVNGENRHEVARWLADYEQTQIGIWPNQSPVSERTGPRLIQRSDDGEVNSSSDNSTQAKQTAVWSGQSPDPRKSEPRPGFLPADPEPNSHPAEPQQTKVWSNQSLAPQESPTNEGVKSQASPPKQRKQTNDWSDQSPALVMRSTTSTSDVVAADKAGGTSERQDAGTHLHPLSIPGVGTPEIGMADTDDGGTHLTAPIMGGSFGSTSLTGDFGTPRNGDPRSPNRTPQERHKSTGPGDPRLSPPSIDNRRVYAEQQSKTKQLRPSLDSKLFVILVSCLLLSLCIFLTASSLALISQVCNSIKVCANHHSLVRIK